MRYNAVSIDKLSTLNGQKRHFSKKSTIDNQQVTWVVNSVKNPSLSAISH